MQIKSVSESEFYKIYEKKPPFWVYFWAGWCTSCRETCTALEEVLTLNPKLKIYMVDVDDYTDLANSLGVINVPTVLAFKDKKIVGCAEGKITQNELAELMI